MREKLPDSEPHRPGMSADDLARGRWKWFRRDDGSHWSPGPDCGRKQL